MEGDKIYSDINASLENWNYIFAQYNENSGNFSLWFNNIFEGQRTKNSYLIPSTGDIQLGGNEFDGQIDEFAVYTRSLDDVKRAKSYREAQAKFVDYEAGLYGTSVYFDGANDYMKFDSSVLPFDGFNKSIEVWFKTLNSSKNQVLLREGDLSANGFEISLEQDPSGLLRVVFKEEGGSSRKSGPLINSSKWYHILYVGGSGDGDTLYVNGKEESLTGSDLDVTDSSETVFLGFDGSSNYFHGYIDEIKVYNRSLYPDYVNALYYNYASVSKGCCNYVSLVNPNTSSYPIPQNVAYSTNAYYGAVTRGLNASYTVNSTYAALNEISSHHTNVSGPYLNFTIDACVLEAFNVDRYVTDFNFTFGNDGFNCSALISGGVY